MRRILRARSPRVARVKEELALRLIKQGNVLTERRAEEISSFERALRRAEQLLIHTLAIERLLRPRSSGSRRRAASAETKPMAPM